MCGLLWHGIPSAQAVCGGFGSDLLAQTFARVQDTAVAIITPTTTGSGVVWRADGVVLTADHVITDGAPLQVMLAGGDVRPGAVLRRFPAEDLVLIQVPGPLPPPPPHGRASSLARGSDLFAVGNPYGLGAALTTGRVTGLGRSVTSGAVRLDGLLESDLSLHPGDSGGPVFDCQGLFIGLATAVRTAEDGTSIGYAIPVEHLRRVLSIAPASGAP